MLRKLLEEKDMILAEESQGCTFNAALGEDVDSVRPQYSYEETRKRLENCNRKIRILKHAINLFNTSQEVGKTGMTIDQVLVYIPQLTELRNRLFRMQGRLPRQRTAVSGMGSNVVIDYSYANYSVEQAKADYVRVSDELRAVQAALDLVNATVHMQLDLPE